MYLYMQNILHIYLGMNVNYVSHIIHWHQALDQENSTLTSMTISDCKDSVVIWAKSGNNSVVTCGGSAI